MGIGRWQIISKYVIRKLREMEQRKSKNKRGWGDAVARCLS